MTLSAWRSGGHLRILAAWAFACMMSIAAPVAASHVAVVMSDESMPYQEVEQVIRLALEESGHQTSRAYADGVTAGFLSEAKLIVAVGVRAAETLAALPGRQSVLAVLIPRAWYAKVGRARLSDGGRRLTSAIFLDQPFERQAKLIRLAFPETRKVGVLLSAEQRYLADELGDALRAHRIGVVQSLVTDEDRLIIPLEQVLSETDVLLAIPDTLVFNRNTAQSIFLTSYRYRDPIVGYSRSMTRAGALVSVYSTPAQIGQQSAEWIIGVLAHSTLRLPPPAHPAYFEVSINDQVARSLGISLPTEVELEKQLGGVR